MFKKGDIVKYNAVVRGIRNYATNTRQLERRKTERHGIVLGYSFIYTGKVYEHDYEPPAFIVEKSHKVYVIEPLEQYNTWFNNKNNLIIKTNRFIEPVRCLEEDLEIITDE